MPPSVPDLILDTLIFSLEHGLKELEVYPKESFSKAIFYGIQVNHTRHPQVLSYLDGLKEELSKLIKRQRLARIFYDFEMADGPIVSLGISFGEFFLNDGRGLGWRVIGAPSKRDSWITVVSGLKTWFLGIRQSIDQIEGKAIDFNIRISSVPDDQLILDEHWGLDSHFDPNKLIHDDPKVLNLQRIPDLNVNLGEDGNLKLHSYLVKRLR